MDLVKHLFDHLRGGGQCILAALLAFALVTTMVPANAVVAYASEPTNEETTGGDPPSTDASDALADLQEKVDQLETMLADGAAEGQDTEEGTDASNGEEDGLEEAVQPGCSIIEGIEDDAEDPGVATIAEGGIYALAQNAAGTIAIATTDAVTIVGTGCAVEEDGSISSPVTPVHIDATAVPGANVTLQDINIYADADTTLDGAPYLESPIVAFAGEGNTLTVNSRVALDAADANAESALISVPADASLTIQGEGALYLSQKGRGAAIGGNAGQSNGTIALGAAPEAGAGIQLFAKVAGEAAAIGAGANVPQEQAGAIAFRNGSFNLATTGAAPAVGTTASDVAAGPQVTLAAEVNVSINVNGEGAAIRTAEGALTAAAGALRTYIGATEAARAAWGEDAAQATDAALTARPVNANAEALIPLALDTTIIQAAEPWDVRIDGALAYAGGFNGNVFIQEAVDAELVDGASVTNVPQNWTRAAADAWDANLYLHVTPKSHTITVGDQLLLASWDEEAEAFTVTDLAKAKSRMARSADRKVVASLTGSGTFLVNDLKETVASGTVTVTATPNDGNYLAQIRMAEGNANSGLNLDYQVLATPGANGEGEGTFSMTVDLPAGSEDVAIVADFIPIVWDGTLDTTWYDPEATSFNLLYPAQFQGAAAIINGCFTQYPVKANYAPDYDAYKADMGWQENADGTTQNHYYGEFTSTYTQPDTQGFLNRDLGISAFGTIDGFGFSADKTRTTRVVGNVDNIVLYVDDTGAATMSSSSLRYYGKEDFAGKVINIARDMNFGAFVSDIPSSDRVYQAVTHKWSTDSPLYMPLGGSYDMIPLVNNTNGQAIIGSSFNGTLDGCGNTFYNVYCEHFTAGTNYGDSQGTGIVGALGAFNGSKLPSYGNAGSYTVSVRRLVVDETCYVSGRRSVGGIVGRTGNGANAVVEYCINKAFVKATDKFGCAGIVGGAYANGVIDNCANFGPIWHYLANPTGGIVGYNRMNISNCFNVGFVNAGGTAYSMGIGTCDGDGPKMVTNCFYVQERNTNVATGQIDTALGGSSGGYFVVGASDTNNGSTQITAGMRGTPNYSYSSLTLFDAGHMNNGGAAIWLDDKTYVDGDESTKGVNWSPATSMASDLKYAPARNMPMLWFQGDGAEDTSTYKVRVENDPRDGGTVSVSATSGSFGDRIFLSYEAQPGYLFTGYRIEIEGVGVVNTTDSSIGLTGDMTVCGNFKAAQTVEIEWDARDLPCDLSVTQTGFLLSNGEYAPVVNSPIRDEGSRNEVLQGNTLTFAVSNLGSPADATKEYTGVYSISFFLSSPTMGGNVTLSGSTASPVTFLVPNDAVGIEVRDIELKTEFKSWASKADTAWFDLHSTDTQFSISKPEELAGVAVLTEQGISFAGKTISLENDIDMTYVDEQGVQRYWQAIGLDDSAPFSGTFDGQGHTISGLRGFTVGVADNAPRLPEGITYTYGGDKGALFGLLNGATVKNVTIGAENTLVSAGIALRISDSTVENCVNEAPVTQAGIAIQLGSQTTGDVPLLKGCVNNAEIAEGAGIARWAFCAELDGCVNNGAILDGPAGILGRAQGASPSYRVSLVNCVNNGDVTHATDVLSVGCYGTGGIIGETNVKQVDSRTSITIKGCVNTGSIAGNRGGFDEPSTGGIAGYVSADSITDCYNTGAVSSASGHVGGIVGALRNAVGATEVVLANCYNVGSLSNLTDRGSGGILGKNVLVTYDDTSLTDENNFALEAGRTESNVTVVTAEELRTVAPQLGAAWKTTMPDVNDGFPMLAWQLPYDLKYVNGTGETVYSIGLPAGYDNADADVSALFAGDAEEVTGQGARKGYIGAGFSSWVSERNGSEAVSLQNVSGDVLAWPAFDTWIRDLAWATISGSVTSVVNGVVTADLQVVHDGTRLEEGVDYSLTCTPSLSGSSVTAGVSALKGSDCSGTLQAVFVVGAAATAVSPSADIALQGDVLTTSYAFGDQKLVVVPKVERFFSVEDAYAALKSSDLCLPPAGMNLEDFQAFDVSLTMIDLNDPTFVRSLTEFDEGLTINFKLGADANTDYSTYTAFVTQLHDEGDGTISRPLDQAQFPLSQSGVLTLTVNQLSNFAITLASGQAIQGPLPVEPDEGEADDGMTDDEKAFYDLLDKLNQLLGQMVNGSQGNGATVGNGASSGAVPTVAATVGAGAAAPVTKSASVSSGDADLASTGGDVVEEAKTELAEPASSPIADDIVPSAAPSDLDGDLAHDAGIPWWVWLVVAASVAAVAGAVIVVIVRRKKAEDELKAM